MAMVLQEQVKYGPDVDLLLLKFAEVIPASPEREFLHNVLWQTVRDASSLSQFQHKQKDKRRVIITTRMVEHARETKRLRAWLQSDRFQIWTVALGLSPEVVAKNIEEIAAGQHRDLMQTTFKKLGGLTKGRKFKGTRVPSAKP